MRDTLNEEFDKIAAHITALEFLIQILLAQYWALMLSPKKAESARKEILKLAKYKMTVRKDIDTDSAFRVQALTIDVLSSILEKAKDREVQIR